ncbi:MAG: CoA-binding protein [Marinobacter sp.]|uniref:CoA-binding protein n=1 Tax=Marinobacter sp. TaxID=50741 RepID=UPI001B69CC6A|nr:CoA-binding protein [Marinobacter sp.]MBQ0746726.1 CoA-binding protein [Marinobacter sp.]MBQ0814394.1 CoA-binding protein [Marinobacter sp.]|tara:strand:+ start:436 stop:873 length:438 start_codon:yes stop_codon:yes gene_type:complete
MPSNQPDQMRAILESVRTIALVGASEKTHRPSHEVMEFMQGHGYRVIPVNPRLAGQKVLGETVYADITSLPEPVDMVELFLAPERTDAVIDQAIELKVPVIWMQIGVINEVGAARAEAAGLTVVMDKCPKQEIPRQGIPAIGSDL